VLVTGGQGFLGQEVITLLRNQSIETVSVDLPQTQPDLPIDLSLPDAIDKIREIDPAVIVHLAGVQYLNKVNRKKRSAYFHENVKMAENIGSFARHPRTCCRLSL